MLFSSIVNWDYQENFKPIYFFTKRFHTHKNTQANINQQTKIKQTLNNKGKHFLRVRTFKKKKVACFASGTFCAHEIFS